MCYIVHISMYVCTGVPSLFMFTWAFLLRYVLSEHFLNVLSSVLFFEGLFIYKVCHSWCIYEYLLISVSVYISRYEYILTLTLNAQLHMSRRIWADIKLYTCIYVAIHVRIFRCMYLNSYVFALMFNHMHIYVCLCCTHVVAWMNAWRRSWANLVILHSWWYVFLDF